MPKLIPINMRKTPFEDLYRCLGFSSEADLNKRRARLFPLGKAIDEVSTTSIFLASLSAVKEYREELLSQIGVSKIRNANICLHAYTEISNEEGDKRPDGLLVVTSGKRNKIIEWAGFVEAKVGNSPIVDEQVHRYIEFGREVGITDIVTISNQLVTTPNDSPVALDGRRKCNLFHWSWQYLKVMALQLIRNEMVEDEDHVYILTELRRYFDEHKQINNFVNMGRGWTEAIMAIHDHAPNQKVKPEVISTILEAYKQEEKDVALQLTDNTRYHVQLVSKGDRTEVLENSIQDKKVLTSTYQVNGDKNNLFSVDVDLIRHTISCRTQISVNRGKAQAQTTTLLKMLESDAGVTDSINIHAFYPRNRRVEGASLAALLEEKSESLSYSILNKDYGDTVKHFEIKTKDLLGKDFKAPKNFITQLEQIAERFLTQVVENVKR